MSAGDKPTCWSIFKCLFALAGAAGIAPGAALAQDCKLSVHASPQVLYSGQSANVNVLAHIPTPPAPGGAYAFASSTFDLYATDPAWTFASAGAIVGTDVLGINGSQALRPQQGIFADPSNPYRVWKGIFEPQSPDPALVEIEVDPMTFSVYPSNLTSSTAECDVEGGNDFVFVNPLSVGRWEAAPGYGATLEVVEGLVINGLVYAEESGESMSIGIVPTGTVSFFDSSTRVEFDAEPVTFKANVQILGAGDDVFQWDPGDGIDPVRPDARRSRIGSMTVTFDGLETGGHAVGANYLFADGSVRFSAFEGFLGGVRVASGDFNDDGGEPIPGLVVASLPQTIGSTVKTRAARQLKSVNKYGGLTTINEGVVTFLQYDAPIVATVRDSNGFPQVVTLDRIEVRGIREAAARISSANNLKQLSLGCHVFEAEGVKAMWVTPSQGE